METMEPKKVLVVEDSLYLAESLRDMLTMHGYTALMAPNGKEGVRMALEEHPDLILLDIRLPDIDGYQVYHEIRKDEWGKTAKITILTASESVENISKNVDLPIENVLFKPEWGIKELHGHIQSQIG